jgi:proteasome lid subunit RPN8/RPN11
MRSEPVGALKLGDELVGRIRGHAVQSYPHECCGALLGRDGNDGREVLELMPLENHRTDSPRNRFAITAEDVRAAERAARDQGLELVGWYHSHPDGAARPSTYDREHAWPWYSYIIVGVEGSEPREITSWRLAEDRRRFYAEEIETAARARL